MNERAPFYIVFGDHTRTTNFAHENFSVLDNVKVLKPKVFNERVMQYICTCWRKAIPNFGYARHWGLSQKVSFFLPVTSSQKLALDYMERVILKIEGDYIHEMTTYLKTSGLESTELTEKEKSAVQMLRNGEIKWGEFKVGALFELLSAPYLGEKPRQDHVSRQRTDEYCVPVVCAKRGDNGIMYWGRQGDFATYGNVLSVIYNGAIAAGLVYAQKEPTGIFTDSYLIRLRKNNVPFKVNLFLKTSLEKAIYEKYSRELKAVWKRIANDTMMLPVTSSGAIDWDFMESLMTAEARLAIRGVIEWRDKVISKTREIVTAKKP